MIRNREGAAAATYHLLDAGCRRIAVVGAVPHPEHDFSSGSIRTHGYREALAARDNTGLPALADDSGLVVDALDGAPGVYSSRFAGEDATDAQNNAKLLDLMADVPDDERTARFVCTLVFVDTDGSEIVAHGSCEGKIGYEARGDNGFGYDPLFYADAFDGKLTTAEVPSEQKDAISHRGEALRAFIREFEKHD